MLAVQYDGYGDIDVLVVRDIPKPTAGPGEVVIAVKAAGINPGESAIRQGVFAPAALPSGQGSDVAGVIDSVGAGVDTWSVGDEVLGWCFTRASQAEYVAVPADQLIAKPASLPWEVAGAMYVVACTAFAAVRAVGAGTGDTVAVSGAAGGVGSLAVQLLRVRGAAAIGIASESSADYLTSFGATPVAYGDGLADRLRAVRKIDAFIDLFGPEYVQLAVDLGIAKDRINTIISFELAGKLGTKAKGSSEATTVEVLSEMTSLVAGGQLALPVAATYPLTEVRAAFTELEKRHTHGKIVLIP